MLIKEIAIKNFVANEPIDALLRFNLFVDMKHLADNPGSDNPEWLAFIEKWTMIARKKSREITELSKYGCTLAQGGIDKLNWTMASHISNPYEYYIPKADDILGLANIYAKQLAVINAVLRRCAEKNKKNKLV